MSAMFSANKMIQGCNVADIDVVVQWKLPKNLDSFVQRAGRSARGKERTGLAVLLVEPSAYNKKKKGAAEIDSELKAFIQAGACRREEIAKVYRNDLTGVCSNRPCLR